MRSNKKSFKNAKNQYIGVFEGGDHESGLNSDVSRLRSRSGQGHGKVKLKKHHVAGKWLQRSNPPGKYFSC